eukprot:TRINITY_DN4284_c1_g1_i1.p1 TRINITY_DN4284_c1_g1~~TRINITY_DN4284_c1_g1_i1.p1  ORF type:complete len:306 (+),score=87.13 TRINITY_DN4284_c1_g1_i1:36-920(+)
MAIAEPVLPYTKELAQANSLRSSWKNLTAYERHQKYIHDYVMFYGGDASEFAGAPQQKPFATDASILRKNYRFLPTAEDVDGSTWEKRLVKRYYDKLYREYCLADLSRYKTGQVGLRWRTEKEVMAGKGQFVCGAKACSATQQLASYEVMFAYKEDDEKKEALVKLRLCPECAKKLKFKSDSRHQRKQEKLSKSEAKKHHHHGKPLEFPTTNDEHAITPPPASAATPATAIAGTATAVATATTATDAPVDKTRVEEESSHHEILPTTGDEWKVKPQADKTLNEEFDEYFVGLFP